MSHGILGLQSYSLKRLRSLRRSMTAIAMTRSAQVAALVAVAYYFGAQFGFSFRFPGSPLSVIWPPNAIVLAAFVLTPTRMWWPILLAVLPAHVLVEYQNGVGAWTILGLYVTNCGQALLGAAGIRFVFHEPPRLDNLRRIAVFGVCAVFAAPFIVSFLDTAIAVLTDWEMRQQYQAHWGERFVSNALTALILPPVIIVAATHWHDWEPQITPQRCLEAVLLGAGVVASGVLVFGTDIIAATGQTALLYLPLPLLLWAALRFGVGGTSLSLLGIVLLSVGWNAGAAHGPFVAPTPAASVIALQLFLIALSAPMLLLAALIEERNHTAADLRASEVRYRDLVETQTELICRYRPDGTLTFVNEAYCRFYGVEREKVLGMKFFDLLPMAACRRSQAALERFTRNPSMINDEHIVSLPDGTTRWQHWLEYPILGADGALVEIQAIGRDVTARKRAEQEVAWLAGHLLRAQEDERRRIARELHDGTAQTLSAIELILGRLRKSLANTRLDRLKANQLVNEGHSLAVDAVQQIRTLSYLLHPPEQDHLGLAGAIQACADGFTRRSGISVSVAAPDNFGRLSHDAEIALFRVVQECLTNILRHSNSSRTEIRLFAGLGCAAVQVRDFGQGMDSGAAGTSGISSAAGTSGTSDTPWRTDEDPNALGVGIPGMRQRMLEFGGRLKITTGTCGTKITAVLPVRQPASE